MQLNLLVPTLLLAALPAALPAQADAPAGPLPYAGYLRAHGGLTRPPALLGGPIDVQISQSSGGVFVALPDHRELDADVFGTPEHPRAFAGTPVITGLPVGMRNTGKGRFTTAAPLSPFGDKHMVMADGKLTLELHDATATDAANSEDQVRLMASWKDKDGNTYEVRCCRMLATHGLEYPTFGGVVTNTLMHGSTGIGTPLMPTEYVYAAFWGMGAVLKNGKVLAQPRLVHGMLTEYVRTAGYRLAADSAVGPTRRHFHLMLPPMMPDMDAGHFVKSPVPTGFTLPNGMELPFWHVMFENLEVDASRADEAGK